MSEQIKLLPKEVNRVLFVKNLPFQMTDEEMYSLFGKYGTLRQIRRGRPDHPTARGTAFIVYDDIHEANEARRKLHGVSVGGRYIVALFYSEKRMQERREKLGKTPSTTTTTVKAAPAQTPARKSTVEL
ncbi:MAG: hypothetical protein MHM6MM_000220 [Cercozoa sp. M6MM]